MKDAKQIKTIVIIVAASLLGVVLLFLLGMNLTLIIKGAINKDVPPDVFGTAPLAVVSPSMEGTAPDSFGEGALIYIKILSDEDKQALQKGDIVCFRDDDTFVTHRIVAVNQNEQGKTVSFVTMGDANNATDGTIMLENVVGKCTGSVEGLGKFAMFLQTPWGILVFIGIPVIAFVIYDVLRIRNENKKARAEEQNNKNAEQIRSQEEEIQRLQTMLAQKEEIERLQAKLAEKEGTAGESTANPQANSEESAAAPQETSEASEVTPDTESGSDESPKNDSDK